MQITDWETHKKKMLKNPGVRRALKDNKLEYTIARSVIEARIKKGLTQAELAKRIKSRQSVVSRVENAQSTPSLSLLKRIAIALDVPLSVQFK